MTFELGTLDFATLAAAFAAGLGMLLGGAANLLLARAGLPVRVAAAAGACAAAGVGAWLVGGTAQAGWLAAGVVAAGLAAVGVGPGLAAAVAVLRRRPGVRWGGLAATGVAVAVGSVAWHEAAFEATAIRAESDLATLTERPPTRPAPARATTDRGNPVEVLEATDPRDQSDLTTLMERGGVAEHLRTQVIRRQPADDRSNCHGWVFTGGRYWVGGGEVETILADNGYAPVADPRPGDLAVYRNQGQVAHTAVVRYVTPGMPVLVEGKWGATAVFLHAVEASPYGAAVTYYRADRATHVLAGLDVPANAGGQ